MDDANKTDTDRQDEDQNEDRPKEDEGRINPLAPPINVEPGS